MSEKLTHDDLVRRAERWLLNSVGCTFVLTDHLPRMHGEMPDALGFKTLACETFLVEAKTSRSDFMADRNKIWRAHDYLGVGSWRYYLCPPGIIHPQDLPDRWRLLWCHPNRIQRVHDPENVPRRADFTERNTAAERGLMEDALSALQKKIGPFSQTVKPKEDA